LVGPGDVLERCDNFTLTALSNCLPQQTNYIKCVRSARNLSGSCLPMFELQLANKKYLVFQTFKEMNNFLYT